MTTIDLGPAEYCTATDDKGVIRVCDPRSWVLWMSAVWHGRAFRSSPYGVEMWEVCSEDFADTTYAYFIVKHSPLGVVE